MKKNDISSTVIENTLPDYSFKFNRKFYEGDDPNKVTNYTELLSFLDKHKESKVEGSVFAVKKNTGEAKRFKLTKESFVSILKSRKRVFKESIDSFNTVGGEGAGSLIGSQDYTPLLGGPFTKNMLYNDFLQQAQEAFYASTHDPLGKHIVNSMVRFVLGKGYRVDCKDKKALALWKAFERANDIKNQIKMSLRESMIYGETMWRWLPAGTKFLTWKGDDGKLAGKALIPRIRVIDPTACWEAITDPSDINNVFAYQFIFPTQIQTFTVDQVPTTKFIFQQIPAKEMMHYRINVVSNEKRGRSDLFAVLGYLKRLRDVVDYSVIRDLKNSAFCIDTAIDGGKEDIAAYKSSQKSLGTIPKPGSEFVHTKKVERKYLSSEGSSSSDQVSFEQLVNMICIGSSYPVSYLGATIGEQKTRAGAVVGLDPVVKFVEDKQDMCESMLLDISRNLFDSVGVDAELEITFPEIFTSDRSAKIKDTTIAKMEGAISNKRTSEIIAKELGITDYDYNQEQKQIDKEKASEPEMMPINPLTKPGQQPSGVSGDQKKDLRDNEYKTP